MLSFFDLVRIDITRFDRVLLFLSVFFLNSVGIFQFLLVLASLLAYNHSY